MIRAIVQRDGEPLLRSDLSVSPQPRPRSFRSPPLSALLSISWTPVSKPPSWTSLTKRSLMMLAWWMGCPIPATEPSPLLLLSSQYSVDQRSIQLFRQSCPLWPSAIWPQLPSLLFLGQRAPGKRLAASMCLHRRLIREYENGQQRGWGREGRGSRRLS